MELRKISDEICRERGISVLENSEFYSKGKKKEYWVHQNGRKTHRDILKEDIEYCLTWTRNYNGFIRKLEALGYEVDPIRYSVKAPGWERAIRLDRLGYTYEAVEARYAQNKEADPFCLEYNRHLSYRPTKFPLYSLIKRLEFSIERSYDPATVMVDTVFYVLITLFQVLAELPKVKLLSPDMRAAEKDLKNYISDFHYLQDNGIHSLSELEGNIAGLEAQIAELEAKKQKISNQIRRSKSEEDMNQNKEHRKAVTKEITPLRQKLKQAQRIQTQTPRLYELLRQEYKSERKALQRYRERSYER